MVTRGKLILNSVLATLLASGMVLYAEPGGAPDMKPGGAPKECMEGQRGPHGCPRMMPDVDGARKAGASEQQIQALTELWFEKQAQRIDLQATADKAGLKLERLMSASSVDEKAILQAVDALNQARGEIFKLDVTSQLKASQILGDELARKLRKHGPPDDSDRHGLCGPEGQRPSPRDEGFKSHPEQEK